MPDEPQGNELIALAAIRAGAHSAYSHPGPPSGGILESFRRFAPDRHAQWTVNEKVALEISAAEAVSGRRVLCSMKQGGLNVAFDPLVSVAYAGVEGALVVVSADDPGPVGSLTEQDSRFLGVAARIPVLDPSDPQDAWALTLRAFALSAAHRIPVLLRAVARVCLGRRDFEPPSERPQPLSASAGFVRDPERWVAIPRSRPALHVRLQETLARIGEAAYAGFPLPRRNPVAIVASGRPHALLSDLLARQPFPADLVKIDMPHPVPRDFLLRLESAYDRILVVEETLPLLETRFVDRRRVSGREDGAVPSAGELTPGVLADALSAFLCAPGVPVSAEEPPPPATVRTRLCAGCGHRPAFHAIRLAAPNGIFAGDFGCTALGVNLKAVDACLCAGASIPMAEGFKRANPDRNVIAVTGDAAFFHTGIPGLVNALQANAPILVCILDNGTSAMTGFQPVPQEAAGISIENIVHGIGIRFVRTVDPYRLRESVDLVREALAFSRTIRTPAVVVFTHPCATQARQKPFTGPVRVTDRCRNCRVCHETFECPAIGKDPAQDRAAIDRQRCIECGVCIQVCPFQAIESAPEEEEAGT